MDSVECAVVGAGLIGLAVARVLALAGREVVVLEAETAIGQHASSRNSEVIHAGLYYPPGSLKATGCVRGRERLYRYCAERGVPHRACGKLVVATDAHQLAALDAIAARAHANGARDVVRIAAARAQALEPELRCVAALHSPATGILDSHALMLAVLGDAQRAGAMLALGSPLLAARRAPRGLELEVGGREPLRILARHVVNCAGHAAPGVAARISGFPPALVPRQLYAKGNYFALRGRAPFSRLVYPVPEPGGLGVHLTLDLAGQARFGPDVEWVEHVDYAVDPARGERFYAAIRRYWPGLRDDALAPAYCGIRPKISGPGEPAADFVVQGPAQHAIEGLVNLFGIESPGLTASLALADDVAALFRPT
jgi:L-2-hydroxyglutarate oxidase LhgO